MGTSRSDADPDTRTRIVLAAGELFAQRGLDGVGVRDIVTRAGVALSAVNYHFGSKTELYTACLRYVLEEHIHVTRLFDALIQDPGDRSAADTVAALLDGARAFVSATFAAEQPEWFGRIFMRAWLELPAKQFALLRDTLAPLDDALRRLAGRHRPDLSRTQVQIMINGLYAKVHMSMLAKDVILEDLACADYDAHYLAGLALDVARGVTSTLGLPDPATIHGAGRAGGEIDAGPAPGAAGAEKRPERNGAHG
ncbi:MAG: TetR/AcrR family transcriptional regulator [Planctomycetes bacterium]|nr:TetR/AcrR family transcriptional regulator [Planctomycetota bacterium]